ncbi:hypothetical protein K493DRAFT_79453 [Basidiobolus meristosporus CBS 931.73]|uniref:Uncharacterized protein n=1 Tax=Basidiobolus meristosporus CBS 931.73 TaxID=1314790 RepID=A0A1Y1XS52_9FUNG|nr:hypothetical protein K493DRAFT_79453 [Basidiobolus meristosporus CBS 931.73]|eukprot:ORX88144.1 hypothetical protein K493DRAFT_79453 [Basidiobolus meristosporus CBS 931.73]
MAKRIRLLPAIFPFQSSEAASNLGTAGYWCSPFFTYHICAHTRSPTRTSSQEGGPASMLAVLDQPRPTREPPSENPHDHPAKRARNKGIFNDEYGQQNKIIPPTR